MRSVQVLWACAGYLYITPHHPEGIDRYVENDTQP